MEIIIAVVSFVLGYLAEKIFDKILEKFFNAFRIKANKKKRKMLEKKYKIDAICTEYIYPFVSPKDIWTKSKDSKSLLLAFPKDLLSKLRGVEGAFSAEDLSFCDFILPGYKTEEICATIESARQEIAIKFINRDDGLYFNGDKYGVSFLDAKSRSTDIKESPRLLLELYRTDHFTHRVITRALEILDPPIGMFSSDSLNNDLKWIRTSFGISIIVILKSVNQIVLTHRSKNVSFSNGKNWIYVSVTEALTKSDIDEYESQPDLTLCVQRGIKEELGIEKNMYSQDDIKFYDCFFETHFFQDGIVSSVELLEDILPQDILEMRAKDKKLEVEDIFFIDNNKSAIQKFISDNYTEMRSQTVFALESYLSTL